jgi:hypothetical protein
LASASACWLQLISAVRLKAAIIFSLKLLVFAPLMLLSFIAQFAQAKEPCEEPIFASELARLAPSVSGSFQNVGCGYVSNQLVAVLVISGQEDRPGRIPDDRTGNYYLKILTLDVKSGQIIGRYVSEGEYESDAFEFLGIEVVPFKGEIEKGSLQFGVVASNSTRWSSYKTLSLFISQGPKIKKVLSGLQIQSESYPPKGICEEGESSEAARTVSTVREKGSQFVSLLVRGQSSVKRVPFPHGSNGCAPMRATSRTERFTLKYKHGTYAVPSRKVRIDFP